MGPKNSAGLTIGALAKATGVGVETVRLYHRRGLLDTPLADGYRRYGPAHEQRIRFIRQAQSLGFSLDDIASLLQLDEEKDHQLARTMAQAKISVIESRIRQLQDIAGALRKLVHTCEHAGTMPCPIISMSLGEAESVA